MSRKRSDEELTRLKESSPAAFDAKTNTAKPARNTERPDAFTEGDFEDALDRVSRRESPPDPEN